MKQILAVLLVTVFSMTLLADMVREKEKSEKSKKTGFVHSFASRECKRRDFVSSDRCMANYCTQADAVEVYLLIGSKEYSHAVDCFKKVFEPCAVSCSAGTSDSVAPKCNRLLNSCIRSR